MAGQDAQPFHWEYTELDDRNFQIRGRTVFYVVVIFSIIILVTLLVFYARWICRFNSNSHRLGSSSSSYTVNTPQSRATQGGLDAADIRAIPVVVICHSPSSSSIKMMDCSICLGPIEEGQKVKVLPPCQHCYHCECVDRWLAAQPICPLCRANIRFDSTLQHLPVVAL